MKKEIKEYLSTIGKKGGSRTSDRKREASKISLEIARAVRWQNKQTNQSKKGVL